VARNEGEKILILYDGPTTHINQELIKSAKNNNIILFVLPPHSSHFLQPLDVACFSPLKNAYNSYAHTFLKENPGSIITRYDMTKLICQAYITALTPQNILSSFKKTGIYPLNKNVINAINFKSS
jgi:hypothetical protein